jgi:membrane fusion protein (multidrug efflux system)
MIKLTKLSNSIKQWLLSPKLRRGLLFCLILLTIIGCVHYWFYNQRYANTDNAYVNANVVQIAPRVTGQIAKLAVVNNQFVYRGQILLSLDPQPFRVALAKAEAQLAIARLHKWAMMQRQS